MRFDYTCPECGIDLEYVVFEAASAYRDQNEIQLSCPHCQEELLFSRQDSGDWGIILIKKETGDVG